MAKDEKAKPGHNCIFLNCELFGDFSTRQYSQAPWTVRVLLLHIWQYSISSSVTGLEGFNMLVLIS